MQKCCRVDFDDATCLEVDFAASGEDRELGMRCDNLEIVAVFRVGLVPKRVLSLINGQKLITMRRSSAGSSRNGRGFSLSVAIIEG
jgi:hypothetical protein